MTIHIELRGEKKVGRLLDRFMSTMVLDLRGGLDNALDLVQHDVAAYPPETSATRPKPGSYGPYYIRGIGSAYRRQAGHTTVYPTSEQLRQRWETRATIQGGDIIGTLANTAGYAELVHLKRKQARFHKRRNWRTVEDGLKRQRLSIKALLERVIARTGRRYFN